jgi:hypothetical protein
MTIDLNNMSLDTKRFLYNSYFSSKTNTSQSFEYKIEILTLLAYLTQQLKKRMPDTFKNAYDVLKNYVLVGVPLELTDEDYISGLSVVCDDLIWGTNDIEAPSKYSNSVEIKNRIKELISGWLPF